MINKFLISEKIDLVGEEVFSVLRELGFVSIELSETNSTNPVWEGLRSGKKYFVKIARNGTSNYLALNMELFMFCELNPQVEVLRFETSDYLVTATEELSLVKGFSTYEVFELMKSYESGLGKISDVFPAERNFDVLLDFSREAISYFQFTGELGSSWISLLERDFDTLRTFFHQSDRVIVHGDVSPANILKSRGKLILIDWGDSFWGFRGFDQLYWLTFLQNSKDLNRSNLEKVGLDIEISQAALNTIILLKEYFHRNSPAVNNRISPKLRLDSTQII